MSPKWTKHGKGQQFPCFVLTNKTRTMTKLQELKAQLEDLYLPMLETDFEIAQRNKVAFILCREIEALENPEAYQENIKHWEGHELRF